MLESWHTYREGVNGKGGACVRSWIGSDGSLTPNRHSAYNSPRPLLRTQGENWGLAKFGQHLDLKLWEGKMDLAPGARVTNVPVPNLQNLKGWAWERDDQLPLPEMKRLQSLAE